VAYVLKITNQTFPVAKLGRGDVISAWSGLRPLIADPNGKPSDISRAHQILSGAPGWIDVAGGKLTTYRLMAEQTVDRITKFLGRKAAACRTAEEPILGAALERGFSALVPVAVTREAVEHYCTAEWARHLDDVMIRRTGWRFYHRDQAEIAQRVAGWMAEVLGWSEERLAQEFERYRRMTRGLAVSWEAPNAGENAGGANEGEAEGVVSALSS
jgi:glycerol-3-phosphate dehydrogenase